MKKFAIIFDGKLIVEYHANRPDAIKSVGERYPGTLPHISEFDTVRDYTSCHSFTVEDFQYYALDNYGVELPFSEAKLAFDRLVKVADCSDGVSWDTIGYILTYLGMVEP